MRIGSLTAKRIAILVIAALLSISLLALLFVCVKKAHERKLAPLLPRLDTGLPVLMTRIDSLPTEFLAADGVAGAYCFSDFKPVKRLGEDEGEFGVVFLISNGKRMYAVKRIEKGARTREADVRQEIESLEQMVGSPFIVRLYRALEDTKHYYLVMEFIDGESLHRHMVKKRLLSEGLTRHIAAEVVIALEHVHSKNYLHNDVQLGNIMLTADGHIKLVDFGLSNKRGLRPGSARGKAGYMAPEVIQKDEYSPASDCFAFGVVIYAMLTGRRAFGDIKDNKDTIMQKTLDQDPEIPSRLSQDAADLLRGLLEKNPKERLGRTTARELRTHSFFRSIDWSMAEERRLKRSTASG